jgi:hypothetical protein
MEAWPRGAARRGGQFARATVYRVLIHINTTAAKPPGIGSTASGIAKMIFVISFAVRRQCF